MSDVTDTIVTSTGGPNWMGWFRVADPPPLELACEGGTYVLDDDGGGGHRYVFLSDGYGGR
jgi:hypothetical protein